MSEPTKAEGAKQLLSSDEAESILNMDDLATEDVYVPEWKRYVRLRQITAAENLAVGDAAGNAATLLIALSVVDDKNVRVFKDHERLRGRSAGAMNLLTKVAIRLNNFTGSAAAAVTAAAAAKNG